MRPDEEPRLRFLLRADKVVEWVSGQKSNEATGDHA
jgi:hypothetical protein